VSSVEAITTDQYPTRTKRPVFSALDCGLIKKHFSINTKPWQGSLEKTLKRILKNPARI